jgi:beta-glucosidase
VEDLTVAQRHYEVIKAGVDQFGGNNDKGPVLEAYQMWVNDYGEESARARFEQSAVRLLLNSFRTGLFENPYLDPALTTEIVGNPEFMQAGYEAQVKSVVMVKNHANTLPKQEKLKVYVPKRHFPRAGGMFGLTPGTAERWDWPVAKELVEKYYEWVDDPKQADFALVMIQGPQSGAGYDVADRNKGGNGYVPISLQYNDYKAVYARAESIAGGDRLEKSANRTYKNKTVKTPNINDLKLVIDTKKAMGAKPVVVVVNLGRPAVLEFEPYADAILVTMGVQNQAVLDLVSGKQEPSGLLPMQLPANMKTVEEQFEDVPRDMECLVDADGNKYDFAFGLNWSGVINDERVAKYK